MHNIISCICNLPCQNIQKITQQYQLHICSWAETPQVNVQHQLNCSFKQAQAKGHVILPPPFPLSSMINICFKNMKLSAILNTAKTYIWHMDNEYWIWELNMELIVYKNCLIWFDLIWFCFDLIWFDEVPSCFALQPYSDLLCL